ncbi:MAG: ribose-5-phosphate isomerase RpiA [Deltaproteobacteria bacterium]|nr:ribose-5-phosphate isomerase RpiA [Deltaproteobacteria bacterium]
MGKDVSEFKKEASAYAVELVESGMVVGLGHGSTSIHAVRYLAEKLKTGKLRNVKGVPCSFQVEEEAMRYGMPLTRLEDLSSIDLTIDGADEVDPNLNMIKGGGGALLREKIVAQISRREVIVVDESKLSPMLGRKRPIPVEVIPFGWQFQHTYLQTLGASVTVRRNADKSLYQTDQGNLILDCNFGPIAQPQHVADLIRQRAGIVEHGLFLNLATDVIVAGSEGIRHLKREPK